MKSLFTDNFPLITTDSELQSLIRKYHAASDFQDVEVEKIWRRFLEAWAVWDCPAMFEHLAHLVSLAHDELYQKPLPPLPLRKGQPKDIPTLATELSTYEFREALNTIAHSRLSLKELQQYSTEHFFGNEGEEEEWQCFIEAVSMRRFRKALKALLGLVQSITADLLWTELGTEPE